jgi:hypothetical protein
VKETIRIDFSFSNLYSSSVVDYPLRKSKLAWSDRRIKEKENVRKGLDMEWDMGFGSLSPRNIQVGILNQNSF